MKMRGIVALGSLALLITATLPAGPRKTPPDPTLLSLKEYRKWTLITPQPIDMAQAIAESCVGPSIIDGSPKNPHPHYVFKVYVNSVGKGAMNVIAPDLPSREAFAYQAFSAQVFPVGSMIVKEKFVAPPGKDAWTLHSALPKNAKPVLLTAMVKRRKGFDPANGDWEYIALSGDALHLSTVRNKYCAECHRSQMKTDYVFGEYGSGSIMHGWGAKYGRRK